MEIFFDNLLFNNCKIVLKRRHKIKSAPSWPLLENEIIFRKDDDEDNDQEIIVHIMK